MCDQGASRRTREPSERSSADACTSGSTRWVLSCCSTTTFCCCCNYQNFASKFAKFDRIFFRFCKSENFAVFYRLSVISRNSDQIPQKSRRKITNLTRFQQHFAKISKNYRNFANFRKKSAFFEFKAVQRYVYLVDLEKC